MWEVWHCSSGFIWKWADRHGHLVDRQPYMSVSVLLPFGQFLQKDSSESLLGRCQSCCWVISSEGNQGLPFQHEGFHFWGTNSVLSCVCCPWIPSLQKVTSDLCRGTAGGGGKGLTKISTHFYLEAHFLESLGLHSQVLSGVRWGDCFVSAVSAPSPCSEGFSFSFFYSGESVRTGPLSAFQLSKRWWCFFLFSLFYIQGCSWTFVRSYRYMSAFYSSCLTRF